MAEAEALLDDVLGNAETGGDVGNGGAGERERAEGLHLVGRMHCGLDPSWHFFRPAEPVRASFAALNH